MTFSKLIFTSFETGDLPDDLWARARTLSKELKLIDQSDASYDQELRSADGVILRLGMGADVDFLDRAPALRYIGMYGTGYGRIDVAAASERGIAVTNVADYSTGAVAEFVVALALSWSRNLHAELTRGMAGDVAETTHNGHELAAMTVGIIGAGHIGRRVTRVLSAGFGARVVYWSRTRRPTLEAETGATFMTVDEILRTADIVTIHMAANSDTEGFIDSARVDLIKRGALLINTAPNELVALDAVKKRCTHGTLQFAMDHADELAVDAFQSLRATPGVDIYPPIGYATVEASEAKSEILISNIEAFAAGSPTNLLS